ncbi:outer membrane beta-barrel protein [Helicobacter acinonychis]|uniref:outer membrane beta-barrel protein n=1 Tax=Helicobacter acinonychis TaxID=212 RepID=UPI001F17D5CF|nr:outer membrane beta-barrel protein [Helicobacter acinonychis]
MPPEKPNAPKVGKYEYRINQVQQSQLSLALESISRNPFKKIGMISSQNNNGILNGIGVQIGYKQFFGKNKIWGLRYYGFLITTMALLNPNFLTPTLMFGLMG